MPVLVLEVVLSGEALAFNHWLDGGVDVVVVDLAGYDFGSDLVVGWFEGFVYDCCWFLSFGLMMREGGRAHASMFCYVDLWWRISEMLT